MSVYTSTEQQAAPTCEVCGRKLGIGYYYTCHVCSRTFCYAHSPAKCDHVKAKQQAKSPLVR
ncbi:MAG: hypothetical protein JRM89_04385 [Nitrososphaerota archaeon]|jgi:hypothetical protein|nr:hypothetical protein [Nitrososphaerota archaeon]MDG6960500.1 hypothetical protein [Nitrososphaerota archaeon]MDG6961511.1 hypothetical protein [Nitrososphaerota archaeon]MDG7015213.1 hypothetical protein [Nitrososphaerota archaeon]WGO49971.1 MAG: hypothetical protein JRM93_03795 [Nitrososphaerota archaeon]